MNDQVNDGGSTPNGIEVALHYYYCCAPHPRLRAGAVQDAVTSLLNAGMMVESEKAGSGYAFSAGVDKHDLRDAVPSNRHDRPAD